MKQIKYCILILVVMNSCKAVSYFNTPNDLFETEATVYMTDGTENKGKISIQFETGYEGNRFILMNDGNKRNKLFVDSITYYKVGEKLYFPKLVDVDFSGAVKLLFLKRLTNEKSRIHLYELYQQRSKTADGVEQFLYFISLPNHQRLEAWNCGSTKFVPNFHDKMSKMLEDCPSLANKIRDKQEGYFLPQLTLSNARKVDVFTKIIEEYNSCQ